MTTAGTSETVSFEHRRYLRVPLDLTVRFRPTHGERWFTGQTTNLSVGGMFVDSDDLPVVGSVVAWQVHRGPEILFSGRGDVRWHRRETTSPGARKGFGVQFDVLDRAAYTQILTIIDDYLKRMPSMAAASPAPVPKNERWRTAALASAAFTTGLLGWVLLHGAMVLH